MVPLLGKPRPHFHSSIGQSRRQHAMRSRRSQRSTYQHSNYWMERVRGGIQLCYYGQTDSKGRGESSEGLYVNCNHSFCQRSLASFVASTQPASKTFTQKIPLRKCFEESLFSSDFAYSEMHLNPLQSVCVLRTRS